MCLQQRH